MATNPTLQQASDEAAAAYLNSMRGGTPLTPVGAAPAAVQPMTFDVYLQDFGRKINRSPAELIGAEGDDGMLWNQAVTNFRDVVLPSEVARAFGPRTNATFVQREIDRLKADFDLRLPSESERLRAMFSGTPVGTPTTKVGTDGAVVDRTRDVVGGLVGGAGETLLGGASLLGQGAYGLVEAGAAALGAEDARQWAQQKRADVVSGAAGVSRDIVQPAATAVKSESGRKLDQLFAQRMDQIKDLPIGDQAIEALRFVEENPAVLAGLTGQMGGSLVGGGPATKALRVALGGTTRGAALLQKIDSMKGVAGTAARTGRNVLVTAPAAAQGVGTVQSDVYNEAVAAGLTPEEANRAANQIITDPELLGVYALASATGPAERFFAGFRGVGSAGNPLVRRSLGAVGGGVKDAVPEAAQGAVEQQTSNVALGRPEGQGVGAAGALEGLAATGPGMLTGALEARPLAEATTTAGTPAPATPEGQASTAAPTDQPAPTGAATTTTAAPGAGLDKAGFNTLIDSVPTVYQQNKEENVAAFAKLGDTENTGDGVLGRLNAIEAQINNDGASGLVDGWDAANAQQRQQYLETTFVQWAGDRKVNKGMFDAGLTEWRKKFAKPTATPEQQQQVQNTLDELAGQPAAPAPAPQQATPAAATPNAAPVEPLEVIHNRREITDAPEGTAILDNILTARGWKPAQVRRLSLDSKKQTILDEGVPTQQEMDAARRAVPLYPTQPTPVKAPVASDQDILRSLQSRMEQDQIARANANRVQMEAPRLPAPVNPLVVSRAGTVGPSAAAVQGEDREQGTFESGAAYAQQQRRKAEAQLVSLELLAQDAFEQQAGVEQATRRKADKLIAAGARKRLSTALTNAEKAAASNKLMKDVAVLDKLEQQLNAADELIRAAPEAVTEEDVQRIRNLTAQLKKKVTIKYSRIGATQLESKSRRGFLTALATVASGVALGVHRVSSLGGLVLGKLSPTSAAFLDAKVNDSAEAALRGSGQSSERLRTALSAMKRGAPKETQSLIDTILDLLPSDFRLVIDDTREVNAHGAVSIGNEGPTLTLFTAGGREGLSNKTVIHETLHLVVAARYHALSVAFVGSNYAKLGMPVPRAMAAIQQFRSLWGELNKELNKDFGNTGDIPVWASEVANDPDEFFVRALVDPDLQTYMAAKRYEGRTLWDRFVSWTKTTLFGAKEGIEASWLDAAVLGANELLAAAREDKADNTLSKAIQQYMEGQTSKYSVVAPSEKKENKAELELMKYIAELRDRRIADHRSALNTQITEPSNYFVKHFVEKRVAVRDLMFETVRKLGGLSPDVNVYDAMTRTDSKASLNVKQADQDILRPLGKKVGDIYARFKDKMNSDEFLASLETLFSLLHGIERNNVLLYEKGKISEVGAVTRNKLMKAVREGRMPYDRYRQAMIANYRLNGLDTIEEFKAAGELTNPQMQALLAPLAKLGFDVALAEELRPELDRAREFVIQQAQADGSFTPDHQNLLRARDWKFYFPLKTAVETVADPLARTKGGTSRHIGSVHQELEGRQTEAQRPMAQLLADVLTAAQAPVQNELARTIFRYVGKYNKSMGLGVEITAYNNTLDKGPVDQKGKALELSDVLSKRSVVYKTGDTYFVIKFPENSKYIEGIKAVTTIHPVLDTTLNIPIWFNGQTFETPTIASAANVRARALTNWFPVWTLTKEFIRTFQTYGAFIYQEFGFTGAKDYFARVTKKGGWVPYASVVFEKGSPRSVAGIRQMALDGNKYAKDIVELMDEGGFAEFAQRLNPERVTADIARDLRKLSGNRVLRGVQETASKYIEVMDGLSTMVDLSTRLAAYQTAKKVGGYSNAQAAAYAKKMFDFQQGGLNSATLNVFFTFFRSSLTSIDRQWQGFKNERGEFDWKDPRVRRGLTSLAAMGGLWYLVSMALFSMFGYDDDDIAKIDDDTFTNNIVLPNPFEKSRPFIIPLGYQLPQMVFGLGVLSARMGTGHTDPRSWLNTSASTIMRNATPLNVTTDPTDGFWDFIKGTFEAGARATLAGPVVESYLNENSFGDPIARTPNEGQYRSESGKFNTPEAYKDTAKWMREWLGFDIQPELLEHVLSGYLGNLGTQPVRLMDELLYNNPDPDAPYPFLPRVTTRDIEFYEMRKLEAAKKDLSETKKEYNAVVARKGEAVADMQFKFDPTAKARLDMLEQINSLDTKQRKSIAEIQKNPLISKEEKYRLIQAQTKTNRMQLGMLLKQYEDLTD